jgi:hypothetical protein
MIVVRLCRASFVRVWLVGFYKQLKACLATCLQLFVARRDGLLRAFATIFECVFFWAGGISQGCRSGWRTGRASVAKRRDARERRSRECQNHQTSMNLLPRSTCLSPAAWSLTSRYLWTIRSATLFLSPALPREYRQFSA